MTHLAIAMLLTGLSISCMSQPNVAGNGQSTPTARTNPLLGTWTTHFEQTSLTISIEADNSAVVYWDWRGSHTCGRGTWRSLKGGLLVEGIPRFRFWHTGNNDRLLMLMEPLHPSMTGEEMMAFPTRHRMRRVKAGGTTASNAALSSRPLPIGWESESPPEAEKNK